jgi:hypothetical protein
MRTRRTCVLAVLVSSLFLALPSWPNSVRATNHADVAWQFIEIETTVHRVGVETDSQNPEERRWYFSNVVAQPEDVPTSSLIRQKVIPYFSHNVMDPAEARGIAIDYGEQDVRLDGESSYANYETRAEAEKERENAIQYRKGQSGNIYSFELVWGSTKGEEVSKPKLIYRDREQPNYEGPSKGQGPKSNVR